MGFKVILVKQLPQVLSYIGAPSLVLCCVAEQLTAQGSGQLCSMLVPAASA